MTKEEYIALQKEERAAIIKAILDSKASKKLIVAGAGTGKTYAFREVLKLNPNGVNIVMTFIRLLRDDMVYSLGGYAEVRTFHEFCKKILHEKRGGFFLYPKLSTIIKEDSLYLNVVCGNFDNKFQQMDESGNDIQFFLKRGDYYNTVAFNDAVYRMLRELQQDPSILTGFDQILIDEFQDFNLLEVSFIDELEKQGNILIVGDDDQAVYDSRFSTPDHLRRKYDSGNYERYELPFSCRCTEAIVETTNSIVKIALQNGGLKGRIPKRYECFIELKDIDNQKYPKITTAQITNIKTVVKFIRKEIAEISREEIAESWQEGKEYPTVLIVSKIQYLNPVFKHLRNVFSNITYKQSEKTEVSICDGYDFLSHNKKSNLGWRILIDYFMKDQDKKAVVEKTEAGTPMIDILPKEFIEYHTKITDIISKFNKKDEDASKLLQELQKLVDKDLYAEIKSRFISIEELEAVPVKTQPSILLTSYQGCKGMSAGFVFIIGANNGIMPANPDDVSDVELCQFIVALTRTRKKCYIISEDWIYGPKDNNDDWIEKNKPSAFIGLIPEKFHHNLGHLKSKDIN